MTRMMKALAIAAVALAIGTGANASRAAVIDTGSGTVDLGNAAFLDGQWRTGTTGGAGGWSMDPSGLVSLLPGGGAKLYYLVLQVQNSAGSTVTLNFPNPPPTLPPSFDVSAQILAWQSSGVAPTIDLTAVDLTSLFGSITLNDAIALLPLNSGSSVSTAQVTSLPLVTGGSANIGNTNFGIANTGSGNIGFGEPYHLAVLIGGQNGSTTPAPLGTVSVNEVPVPASLPLVLAGVGALVAFGRRRRA